MNIDFDQFVASNKAFHKKYGNIYISEIQFDILYKYSDTASLLYDIEEYLNNNDNLDDLDWVSQEISEYNYYNNTNK